MNKWLGIFAAGLICTFLVVGCKKYEPVLPPDIKLNSNPVEKYKVILNIRNPPFPIRVTGEATYGISNTGRCVPIDSRRSLGGSRPHFRKTVELAVRKVSENTYEMFFYADSVKHENYFGKGVCEWSGSPAYRIHWSGSTYAITSGRRVEPGEAVTRVCGSKPSHPIGSCVNEEYAKNASPETHFYYEITTYKE